MKHESGGDNTVRKLVAFVRGHGGIANIHALSLASTLECHPSTVHRVIGYLKDKNVLTQMSFGGNGKGDKWALNEKMIEAGEQVTNYLSKFLKEGAPINASAFAQSRGLSVALMGITIDAFCKLGVLSIKPNKGSIPNYLLEEEDSSVWKDLWKPKLSFSNPESGKISNSESLSVGERFVNLIKVKGGCVEGGSFEFAEALNCTKSGFLFAIERLEDDNKIVIKQKSRKGDKTSKGIYALPDFIEDKWAVVEKTPSTKSLEVQLNEALKDKIQAQEQAIQFGRALEQANVKIKELELRIDGLEKSGVRKENEDLSRVANRNGDELERLSKSFSV